MTKITVEVMKADIRYGKRADPEWCPIAFATKRLLKPRYRVDVGRFDLVIHYQGSELWIRLPERAIEFTKEFDRGKVVKPFSFELDIPERFLR